MTKPVIHLIALLKESCKLYNDTRKNKCCYCQYEPKGKKAVLIQEEHRQKGVLTLKDLLHLPLHSLQAPDVLYFALFFCRGKQLRETKRMVIKGEQDLSFSFNSLKWPCVDSVNPLNCTFRLDCKSQRSFTMMCVCVCVPATAGACVFEGVCTPDF